MRTRALMALLALTATSFAVSGCGDDAAEPGSSTPPTSAATNGGESPSGGVEVEYSTVVSGQRQEPPTGHPPVDFAAPPRTEAEVTTELASRWSDWSTIGSDGEVPEIAPESVAILVWDSGKRFEITSVALGDSGLVISAQRRTLGRGCFETDELGGTTTVLSTDDPAVSGETAVADIVVTEVPGPGCDQVP